MADFEKAVAKLLVIEGGYAPNDNRNGAVNFGITAAFLKLIGWPDPDPANLTVADAVGIYRKHFWDLFQLAALDDQEVATVLLAAVVNMHPRRAIRSLQRAVGAKDDGIMGPATIAAVNRAGGVAALLRTELKGEYRALAAMNPALYGDDLAGWLKRVDA
jgi:lysozyme family protein